MGVYEKLAAPKIDREVTAFMTCSGWHRIERGKSAWSNRFFRFPLEKRAAVALRCHYRRKANDQRNRDAPNVGVRRHGAPRKRALIDEDLVKFLALGLVDGHQVQSAPLLLRGDEALLQ